MSGEVRDDSRLVRVVMQSPQERDDPELYRRESMGAFAHEVRTPLTSIKMVMELARRQSQDGELLLDSELAGMLRSSVDDLQRLADDLQEASRLERGRFTLSTGPCELGAVIDTARQALENLQLDGRPDSFIEGLWDGAALARAIVGFAQSANRIGDGSGVVKLEALRGPDSAEIVLTSGRRNASLKAISADAGFSFFRSRQLVLAMGGSVHCERAERFATFRVVLPLRERESAGE